MSDRLVFVYLVRHDLKLVRVEIVLRERGDSSRLGMTMGLMRSLVVILIVVFAYVPWAARAQLSTSFYASSCPNLELTVNAGLQTALQSDGRIGASLLRAHFHDCFVQGCDGSVLLDDTPTFTGEQSAPPNIGSLRGLDVVATIKSSVEAICPGTVSCADLLALIARDAVISAGGPFWFVEYGRRDSTTACFSCTSDIPAPSDSVSQLTTAFANKGLDQTDMVTLSGAHTIGKAHCTVFSGRLTSFDPTLNPTYLSTLQGECSTPSGISTTTVVNLDLTTPFVFDNSYYSNLLSNDGLLTSDQNLESEGGATASTVSDYASTQIDFFNQFSQSIVKLGRLSPLTGSAGEIRSICSAVN